MTVIQTEAEIAKFINEQLPNVKNIYDWKKPKMEKFPIQEYRLTGDTSYEVNRNLRSFINQLVKDKHPQSASCQTWYVNNWGGVTSNKTETLEKYIVSSEQELIQLGKNGIASWSKILAVRDQEKYAIYDARVALSLISIQKVLKINDPIRFPMLPTKNTSFVRPAYEKIKLWTNYSEKSAPRKFYSVYLNILQNSIKNSPSYDIQDVEMILFAASKELSQVWHN